MTEAKLVPAKEGGLVPEGDGWFVLNAKAARWLDGDLGKYTGFEAGESRFPQLGINLNVLVPGEAMTMHHRENAQEDFLVLAGECLLSARTGAEDDGLVYPADPVAQQHGAGVAEETADPKLAYQPFEFRRTGYEAGW